MEREVTVVRGQGPAAPTGTGIDREAPLPTGEAARREAEGEIDVGAEREVRGRANETAEDEAPERVRADAHREGEGRGAVIGIALVAVLEAVSAPGREPGAHIGPGLGRDGQGRRAARKKNGDRQRFPDVARRQSAEAAGAQTNGVGVHVGPGAYQRERNSASCYARDPMRATAFIAMAVLLAANAVGATPPLAAAAPPSKPQRVARVVPPVKRVLATTSAPGVDAVQPWAAALGAIDVLNRNTNGRAKIRLYDDHGVLDRGEARSFMRVAGSAHREPDDASDDDERLDLRVVQLAIRASYHFNGAPIEIVSATRPRHERQARHR